MELKERYVIILSLLGIPSTMLFILLAVIYSNSCTFYIVPTSGFFTLIIQISSGLIASGSIIIFVFQEMERRISEYNTRIKELSASAQTSGVIMGDKKAETFPSQMMMWISGWISEYALREKKVLKYGILVISSSIISISISLGCIIVPISEKKVLIGSMWAWISFFSIGIGSGSLILTLRELLKSMPKKSTIDGN